MAELKLTSKHSGSLKHLIEEGKDQLSTEEFLHRYENNRFREKLELDEWIGELRLLQRLQEIVER